MKAVIYGMKGGKVYEQSKKEIFKCCIQWSGGMERFICVHREFFI